MFIHWIELTARGKQQLSYIYIYIYIYTHTHTHTHTHIYLHTRTQKHSLSLSLSCSLKDCTFLWPYLENLWEPLDFPLVYSTVYWLVFCQLTCSWQFSCKTLTFRKWCAGPWCPVGAWWSRQCCEFHGTQVWTSDCKWYGDVGYTVYRFYRKDCWSRSQWENDWNSVINSRVWWNNVKGIQRNSWRLLYYSVSMYVKVQFGYKVELLCWTSIGQWTKI